MQEFPTVSLDFTLSFNQFCHFHFGPPVLLGLKTITIVKLASKQHRKTSHTAVHGRANHSRSLSKLQRKADTDTQTLKPRWAVLSECFPKVLIEFRCLRKPKRSGHRLCNKTVVTR